MQTFIDDVLSLELKETASAKTYILPSRRAGTILRQKLAAQSTATTFAPQIYSIEEFIEHIAGLSTGSNIQLTFTLYESYKEVITDDPVTFQVFCSWAQPMLSDFNEIDRYLLDQQSIFNHLRDIKEISNHWSSSTNELVVNYVNFWNSLAPIYKSFCEKCLNQKTVHQGYIYRQAVDAVEHYIDSNLDTRHIFLGFNALNTAEQQLIQALLAKGTNTIYWDTENHFLKNKSHEAGLFIRAHKGNWPYYKGNTFTSINNNYASSKHFNVYTVSQDVHQAKTVGSILSESSIEEISKTAIILGDESLLIPILNSLPKKITRVNITMGIPLSKTPTASFFDQLITLKKQVSNRGFYYKDLLVFLQNPLTSKLLGDSVNTIQKEITKQNKIFIPSEDFQINEDLIYSNLVNILFKQWTDSPIIALDNIIEIIEIFKNIFSKESHSLQLEYIYGFFKAFNKLKEITQTHSYIEDIPTLIYFYREVVSSETIDLTGDPEQGLQIMGVLESRVLDYERIIVTSVNESVLPSGKSQNSYIPYDLKKLYNLPTYAEKDAIYAYHFYHLLHRSKHINLLYTTQSEGLGGSEPSRFIRQLEQEKIHTIHHHTVTPAITYNIPYTRVIYKDDIILKEINNLLKRGISPSALTTYIRNPLRFYERYVLRINDSDSVEETVAANTMGTIVHNALEVLYTPYISKQITVQILKQLTTQVTQEVTNQFKKEYGLAHITEGKNHIIYEVVCRYVENYLHKEIQRITNGDTVFIKALEEDLKGIHLIDDVYLRGKVDLVEERNGNLNIIDYKTGKVEQRDLNLSDWQDLLLPEGKSEKAFQVLMYAYMMNKSKPLNLPVSVGIISFKNLQSGYLPFRFNRSEAVTEETLLQFEFILQQLINEILDPTIPFQERV